MTLDERTSEIYAALDDMTLLALLATLRDERDRHMNLTAEVGKVYREAVGEDISTPRTMHEFLDRLQAAAGDEAIRDGVELAMAAAAASEEEADLVLNDPRVWLEFSSGYAVDLGEREHWVRTELARRGLLPAEPGSPSRAR